MSKLQREDGIAALLSLKAAFGGDITAEEAGQTWDRLTAQERSDLLELGGILSHPALKEDLQNVLGEETEPPLPTGGVRVKKKGRISTNAASKNR